LKRDESKLNINFPRIYIAVTFLFLLSACAATNNLPPVSSTQVHTATQVITPTSTPSPTDIIPPATPTPTPTYAPTVIVIDSMVSEMDGMVMVYVPQGEFTMGADRRIGYQACQDLFEPLGEYNTCYEDVFKKEEPPHPVLLDAYWIDQTEITNAMFVEFLNKIGNNIEGGDPWYDSSDSNARIQEQGGIWVVDESFGNHPVTLVTWYGANAYCDYVLRRLPTEAEWEKAARGTDKRNYPWGNDFDGTRLNFCDVNCENISIPYFDDGFSMTAPVGIFPLGASPYGVLDMAGNVYEWVFDWYDDYYFESSPYENPKGPSASVDESRGLRGGSWLTPGDYTRTTDRTSRFPLFEEIDTGFRCVISEK
jgi:formylglycine-generating enzyme required for sulfatase activity